MYGLRPNRCLALVVSPRPLAIEEGSLMSAPPRARPAPLPSITARDPSSNSVTSHLATCLKAMGATALADTVERCSTHFRVLACDSGHGICWIPADRCRHRLCPRCARDEPLPTRVNRLQR